MTSPFDIEQPQLFPSPSNRLYTVQLRTGEEDANIMVKYAIHDRLSNLLVREGLDFKHNSPNGLHAALIWLWEQIERDRQSDGIQWPNYWDHMNALKPF